MVIKASMRLLTAVLAGSFALTGGSAGAAQPEPWQIGLQPAATPIMEMIHRFNDGVLIVITAIALFVLALLLYVMIRFNSRTNPVPSRTSHNTLIEVLWTVLPILILVGIAVPSFSLLFAQHDPARAIPGYDPVADPPLVIKATGSQWYWNYEYPDDGEISIDSLMLTDEERAADPSSGPRLLAVDNPMIVPVGKVVRLQVIGADVIHAFAVPAFGIKIDAIPGRLNETWFRVDQEGMYYGQCSELCGQSVIGEGGSLAGTGHAFMPIAVRAVTPEQFATWATAAADDLDEGYATLPAVSAPGPTAATE